MKELGFFGMIIPDEFDGFGVVIGVIFPHIPGDGVDLIVRIYIPIGIRIAIHIGIIVIGIG